MSYSPMQAPIIADDDEMTRLLEQMFGGATVASNTAVSGPSLEQTAIAEDDVVLCGNGADVFDAVEPVNGVEEKENDANENVDGVKEQLAIILPEQNTQIPNDDDNILQNLENIYTHNPIFSSSGDMGINCQFPASESENVNCQTAMDANVNGGINYEFPASGPESSFNHYNYYNLQTTMHENVSQNADFQVDFEMMRYALEPNDSTSYMGNYIFPNDETAFQEVDNLLCFPTPTQATQPVAEGNDFVSTSVVQKNGNHVGFILFLPPNPALMPLIAQQQAVIANHDPVPMTANDNLADPSQTVGDYDSFLLPFPSPTQSNHPAAEGTGFLESNSDVQSNDNNVGFYRFIPQFCFSDVQQNAVVGDNSRLPVAYNDTPAPPQAPANMQGAGGFFVLPYCNPSTGQISHVPFSIPIPNPAAGDHYPIPSTNDNNLVVPDQTQAVGDGEYNEDKNNSSLCFPSPTQSNHPAVKGSLLESNPDVQNNNDNNNAVVGYNSRIPINNNDDMALPQAPANVQGSEGFFLLSYYDPSTGQTSQVPFPVSALQGIMMDQLNHFAPNQPNGIRRLNTFYLGGSIPADMGLLDYTNPTINFGASAMSGGLPIPNQTDVPPVNVDWHHPIPSSSFHVSPIIGSKRPLNEESRTHETISRPRKCRYRGQVKPPAYHHPHSLEQRKTAPPYVKIGQKDVFLCNYIGPAEVNESRICGQPLMTGKRNCLRHVAKHAEREEKMIEAGVLRLEDAHALFWAEKICFQCAHCGHQEFVWRTDGVRAKHEAEFHPEIFANRPKVVRRKKGKEGTETGKRKGKGKGKGKEREGDINDENA
ncbi:hypothetical protein Clacol_008662 [Clathrus columnatus]|uniref:Uncharacterized protein n=1 Tax=Clathrus columnatus TaxID=1419009 RepID=A0AAV5ANZ4_9AGAM|nr:hypothetical protein Clacol_008662 [Clathrus columnatus]